MKIFVLHGEDTTKSYERLAKFVDAAHSRSWEVKYINPAEEDLGEALSGASLFGSERFFVLRDFKKLGKKQLTWINKKIGSLEGNLIIYHPDTLTPTMLKSLPKEAKVEEFKLPKLLWNFLDTLEPGKSKKILTEFHKIIEKEPVELVFSLIAKQFRDVFWVKTGEGKALPDWKRSRLKTQSSKFTVKDLRDIISELAEIDIAVKSSNADLVSSLDLFIVMRLQ
jgi:DNA polymerase III delta subunit